MLSKTLFTLTSIYIFYLIIDALRTGSILVKGGKGEWGIWAHKKTKQEDPASYWFFLSFYIAALGLMLYIVLFADMKI